MASHLRNNVVGYLALFVALSGTTYAATSKLLPKNSVASPQVVNGSLKTVDLSRRARSALKGARGARGPAGPTGTRGPTGAVGPLTGPAGGDLTGNYPNPAIKAGAVTPAKLAPEEGWHTVGDPGEPGFSGMIGLNSYGGCGLTHYGGSFRKVSFYKDRGGVVHLGGLVSNSNSGVGVSSNCAMVFQLPAAYQPASEVLAIGMSNGGATRIEIYGTNEPYFPGVVYLYDGLGPSGWASLEGITFRAG